MSELKDTIKDINTSLSRPINHIGHILITFEQARQLTKAADLLIEIHTDADIGYLDHVNLDWITRADAVIMGDEA